MSFSVESEIRPDWTVIAKVEGGKLDGKYLVIRAEGLGHKSFQLRDGKLIPVLSKEGINAVYMAGPRKSGKTTLLSKMLNLSHKDVFLLTRLGEGEDDSLNIDNDVDRIDINQLLDDPLDWKELSGRIVVIDDGETHPDPRINKAVQTLADQVLESGRRDIPAIIRTGHFLMNGKQTRQGLMESNFIVIFHHNGLDYQTMRFLKEHAGLSKGQIGQVMATPGRWFGFYRQAPNCFLGENSFTMF